MTHKSIILLSCEHAVNDIPMSYHDLFSQQQALLNSHRGIDYGALEIAQNLACLLNVKLISATVSRLLIDCNRSLTHPHCFSEISKCLPTTTKQQIIAQHYLPYRQNIQRFIQQEINHNHQVVHLSIHSFTPELHGKIRKVDIGLLYDPNRLNEKNFVHNYKKSLTTGSKHLKIRLNSPYQGKSDGMTTALRKQFPYEYYIGIEIEINQALLKIPITTTQIAQMLFTTLPQLNY